MKPFGFAVDKAKSPGLDPKQLAESVLYSQQSPLVLSSVVEKGSQCSFRSYISRIQFRFQSWAARVTSVSKKKHSSSKVRNAQCTLNCSFSSSLFKLGDRKYSIMSERCFSCDFSFPIDLPKQTKMFPYLSINLIKITKMMCFS